MTTREAPLGQIFTPAARELAGGWRRKAEELKATADAPDLELPGELPVHPELLHGMAEALNLAAGQLEALALVADRLAGEVELGEAEGHRAKGAPLGPLEAGEEDQELQRCPECGHRHWGGPGRSYAPCRVAGCGCNGRPS